MSDSSQHLRIGFTAVHLFLVALGSLNILLIALILYKPYLRSITNVYMLGLCLADLIYLTDLVFVAATSLNGKSWPFGSVLCTMYHGTETTAKYASVLFITLLAADRYFAVCRSHVAARYRSYKTAITLSILAWTIALLFSYPLYYYGKERAYRVRGKAGMEEVDRMMCMIHWPDPQMSPWYVGVCGTVLFITPGCIVIFCYRAVYIKLKDHMRMQDSTRIRRSGNNRYRKVTQMVQRVVVFHLACWAPFWLFNMYSTLMRVRVNTLFLRIIINIIHIFPYVNCAINPILYAHGAENFRTAFKELFLCAQGDGTVEPIPSTTATRSTCYRNSGNVAALEFPPPRTVSRAAESASYYQPEDDETDYPAPEINHCASVRRSSNHLEVRFDDQRSSTKTVVMTDGKGENGVAL